VHNASSGQSGTPIKLEEIDDARWDEQYATALDAPFYLAQASFEHLKRGGRGRFIILSSSQALHGGAMNPVYVAVKSAQRGLVKGLAREWGPHGIVVNGIAPASETDTSRTYFEQYPQVREQILGNVRCAVSATRASTSAAPSLLCAATRCSFVTGQVIPVDGGGYTAL
jgi:3-oxoacyl-[acyl-carrier protein] reductase